MVLVLEQLEQQNKTSSVKTFVIRKKMGEKSFNLKIDMIILKDVL